MKKTKVFTVIGSIKNPKTGLPLDLEKYFLSKLGDEYLIKDDIGTKEGIQKSINEFNPDILVIYEDFITGLNSITSTSLKEKANEEIINFVSRNKKMHPNMRIIIFLRNRKKEDKVFNDLIMRGVYDFSHSSVSSQQMISLIKEANTFEDVEDYAEAYESAKENANVVEKKVLRVLEEEVVEKPREKAEKEALKEKTQKNKEMEKQERLKEEELRKKEEEKEKEREKLEKAEEKEREKLEKAKAKEKEKLEKAKAKAEKKKNKKPSSVGKALKIIASMVAVIVILGAVGFGAYKSLEPNVAKEEVKDDTEMLFREALREGTAKNYQRASEIYDKIDYNSLQNEEDKDAMKLGYLFANQPQKAIDLDESFTESVINFYYANDNEDEIVKLANDNESIAVLQFEKALINEDFETIVSYKDDVSLDERREEAIVIAHLELDDLDGAKEFVIEREKPELLNIIDEFEEEQKKIEEEAKKKESKSKEETKEEVSKDSKEKIKTA